MSSAGDAAQDIFGQNANQRTLAPGAVGSQVLLMTVISIITVLVFNILRPRNKIVYEPKVKYHVGDKPPPRISDSLLGWLPPLIHTKEPELLDKVGLDAVAFLRFLRLFRWLFTCIAILTCGVLIPVNVNYNLKHVPPENRDALSMLTIRDVKEGTLYIPVAVSYGVTILVVVFVYVHWAAMVRLRRQWYRSPEYIQSFYARTLMSMHVPKKFQSDEGIRAIFESVKVPYPTTSVHIGRKVGRLPELIEYHNDAVRELERVLVRYLKGGRIGKERPTIRIGGFMGCGGVRKDAIEFYTNKLKRTEGAILEYRNDIDTRRPENYGFASMAAVPYAHIVAHILRNKHPKGTDISLAPNPKDIIWENLNKSDGEVARKKMAGFFWLALVCFFNTVPLFVISILANLNSLTGYIPFLANWSKSSPSSFNFVSAFLPPAVQGVFGVALPYIMRWLSKYQGAPTHSRLDRAVIARYFFFLVISQLVIFTLIGVTFNSVREIVKQIGRHRKFSEILANLDKLPGTINRTYIDQAGFWLTWFPVRGFVVVFDLAQILNLVWISFRTKVFGRTPRDIREWTQPPEFEYAIYYSNMLFMGTVALVFALLAPLVVVLAAVVFWLSSWVYKYQLMFVFISKVETGGRLWNVIMNRLLISVILMQLLMVLTIGLQYQFRSLQWIGTVPPILIIIAFKIFCNAHFDSAFRYYIPSEEEIRVAKIHSERADHQGHRLEKRFGHPALNAELFTPMLHAKMMPLLGQVYRGKINDTSAKLNEYGGEKKQAQVVPGGIMIAAVDQHDLEYDPRLYQRDRGELDWDQRSMATTLYNTPGRQSQFFDVNPAPPLPGYDQYHQAHRGNEYEMTPIDVTNDQQRPLLYQSHQGSGYFDQRPPSQHSQSYSHTTSPSQQLRPIGSRQSMQMPSNLYQNQVDGGYREAPVHRPYASSGHAPSTFSGYSGASGQQPYPAGTPGQFQPGHGRGAYQGSY